MKKKTLLYTGFHPDYYGFVFLAQETVAQVLGKQVLRSGTSVGANYREAKRARTKAEFISKVGDCLKEADETFYW